jgi:hypothetical protein
MAYTRAQIRQRIGGPEFCGDTILSTATSGTLGTMADTSLKQPDDFYNYGQLLILDGTASGDARYVTDWAQSASVFTVDRNFTAAVSTNAYEIHRIWSAADKNVCINAAILASGLRWPRRIEDASLTLDTETYTYDLTALGVPVDPYFGIDEVYYDTGISGTGAPYAQIPRNEYEVRVTGTYGTLSTLQFVTDIRRDAATVRLTYRTRPPTLSADADILRPDDVSFYNYICCKATAMLFRQRAKQQQNAGWEDRALEMERMAEGFYDLDRPNKQGRGIRLPLWG